LVVPVQSGGLSFDPIERELITRIISDGIANTKDALVANPSFVLRFFGMNRYAYSTDERLELAELTQADEIVELYADHDGKGNFDFRISVLERSSKRTLRSKTWQLLRYDDSHPPYQAVVSILHELIAFSVGANISFGITKTKFDVENFRFPDSLNNLKTRSKKNPLESAAYLQLLGMLHPRGIYNEARNGLFERSLVELQKIEPSSPYYKYFAARALAYLDRRPAAIEVLGEPTNPYEKALLAALNGDLVSLREDVPSMKRSALTFMSWRDLQEIEFKYNKQKTRDELITQYVEENPFWGPFIFRALSDSNLWANYSPVTIKLGLESVIPSESGTLETFLTKSVAIGDSPSEWDVVSLLWSSIAEIEQDNLADWNRDQSNGLWPSEIDIVDLARSITLANQIRRVEDDLSKRRSAKSALQNIRQYESLFNGQPEMTLQKARALVLRAGESGGAESQRLGRQAAELWLNGIAWTGQLTADALYAADIYTQNLNISGTDVPTDNSDLSAQLRIERRLDEWPQSTEWHTSITRQDSMNGALERCLAYAWTHFFCLKELVGNPLQSAGRRYPDRDKLLAENAHRFRGHPGRALLDIEEARLSGSTDNEIEHLQAVVQSGSDDWSVYYVLGRALKRRGDYELAQNLFLSYPGFNELTENTALANSSNAYLAGSMFYWIGQYELAMPLLELSASSGTGSGSDYASAVRIALIAGDLESAKDWSAAEARRYNDKYAIRDLMQILHVTGESEIAWGLFDQVQSVRQDAQMWSGALVGHRMAGATINDIIDWLNTKESRRNAVMEDNANSGAQVSLAQRYLLMSSTMDRKSKPELVDAMKNFRSLAPNEYRLTTAKGIPGAKPIGNVYQGRKRLLNDPLVHVRTKDLPADDGEQIDHRIEMIAKAMVAFQSDSHEEAFNQFDQTARFYRLDEYLPYFAVSASITGKNEQLRVALKVRERELNGRWLREEALSSDLGFRFDEDLTYAVISAFDNDHDEALSRLQDAINNRPYIEERTVYPYYQVVEIASLLYEHTGQAIYRDFALDLARRHTIVLPMYAWAYFVVAEYSESSIERTEAAASGYYLDPLSYRATKLPLGVADSAKKRLATNGAPFLERGTTDPNVGI